MSACTIVIATRNRRDLLHLTLLKLRALPEAPPVVVVDNDSHDGTPGAVRRGHPGVLVVTLPENIGAAARTVGALAADTRYVAFCDDDCTWRAGSIDRAVRLLDRYPGVAVLNARVMVRRARVDAACDLMAASRVPKRTSCPGSAIAQFMAGASVVRRDAFLAAGGYHRRYLIGAEESLLALDLLELGWELVYDPELIVDHEAAAIARDAPLRRMMVLRNRLWTVWLRRSRRAAWGATTRLLRSSCRDAVARAALADALRGLPWVMRERRVVRPDVERVMESLTELPA